MLTDFPVEVTKKLLENQKKDDRLRHYQQVVLNYIEESDNRGCLVYHETGYGKTRLATALALFLNDLGTYDDRIIVLSGKSLHANMRGNIRKYLKENNIDDEIIEEIIEKHFNFVTFNSSNMLSQLGESSYFEKVLDNFNKTVDLNDKIIIVDEAHNLFNAITNGSQNATQFYNHVMDAKNIKIFFLTASPVINHPFELVPCFNMLKGNIIKRIGKGKKENAFDNNLTIMPKDWDDFNEMFIGDGVIKNKEKFQNRILGMVSHYGNRFEEIPDRYKNNTTKEKESNKEKNKGNNTAKESKESNIVKKENNKANNKTKESKENNKANNEIMELSDFDKEFRDAIYKKYDYTVRDPYKTYVDKDRNVIILDMRGAVIKIYDYGPQLSKDILDYISNAYTSKLYYKLPKETKINFVNDFLKNGFKVFSQNEEYVVLLKSTYKKKPPKYVTPVTIKRKDFPDQLPTKFETVPMSVDQFIEYDSARDKEREEANRSKGMKINVSLSKPKSSRSSSYRIKSRQFSNFRLRNPSEADLKDLKKNSPKFKKLLDNIHYYNAKKYNQVIYSNFVNEFGINIIAKCLEVNLIFSEYDSNDTIDKELSLNEKTYAVITGDIEPEIREQIINTFNSKENENGKLINVLLISSVAAEGVDLKRVRVIHMVDQWWNYSRVVQVLARAIRYKSHEDMPESERNVQPIIYLSDYPETVSDDRRKLEKTTDIDMLSNAMYNQRLINSFLVALQEAAFDCAYNVAKAYGIEYINKMCVMCKPTSEPIYINNIADDIRFRNICKKLDDNDVNTYFANIGVGKKNKEKNNEKRQENNIEKNKEKKGGTIDNAEIINIGGSCNYCILPKDQRIIRITQSFIP